MITSHHKTARIFSAWKILNLSYKRKAYQKKIFIALILIALEGLVLSGCSDVLRRLKFNVPVQSMEISADPDANQGVPVVVELVIVSSRGLAQALSKMKAKDYFSQSLQLKNDNPELIESWHWEIIPGQSIMPESIYIHSSMPQAGFIFANYLGEDAYRIRLSKEKSVHLYLRRNNISLQDAPHEVAWWTSEE